MADKPKILNVDDYEPGRYSRSRALRGAGFTVLEAATGGRALELVRAERPQLVVLDINLPDISGFEVCRQIKSDPETRGTLVLHMSATSVGLESKLAGLAGGGDGYLAEPVEPEELVASVHALLRLKQTEEALRESNATLEALVESSPLAVITTDCHGVVQRWNRAAERIFGWTAAEAIGRRNPTATGDLEAEFDSKLQAALTGQPQTGIETVRLRKDGTRIPVSISSAALHDTKGQPIGALALLEDISARKQVEQEMARLYEDARQAAVAKDEFLATLSHELRTPFNAMLGWVQMLRRGEVSPDRVEHALEVIERNATGQLRLIEDILDVSRIISGKLQLQLETVDLVPLALAAAEAMRPATEERRIDFRIALPDRPLHVEGDGSRLQQVMMNLLSNAVKFTPRGGRVELAVHGDDGRAGIVVRDNGTGIDPAFLPHVFERFRQADSARSRAHGGLGLGLAIASHVVQAQNGTITAESDGLGRGACFTISLPMAAPRSVTAAPPTTFAPGDRLDGLRLLVVDDDQDTRELLRHLLEAKGARVDVAASAEEAMTAFSRQRPSVLIADIGMPGEDGLSLVSRVRATLGGRALYAIAVSGYAGAQDRAMAERAGFDEHMSKPVDLARLLTAIARGASISPTE